MGIKRATNHPRKEPFWKRRMKSKIQVLRGEISKLERSTSNPSLKLRGLTQIRKKYFVKKKGLNVAIEELKQRVAAKAEKLRRYEQRVQQYRQNRMFEYDQKKLYKFFAIFGATSGITQLSITEMPSGRPMLETSSAKAQPKRMSKYLKLT